MQLVRFKKENQFKNKSNSSHSTIRSVQSPLFNTPSSKVTISQITQNGGVTHTRKLRASNIGVFFWRERRSPLVPRCCSMRQLSISANQSPGRCHWSPPPVNETPSGITPPSVTFVTNNHPDKNLLKVKLDIGRALIRWQKEQVGGD